MHLNVNFLKTTNGPYYSTYCFNQFKVYAYMYAKTNYMFNKLLSILGSENCGIAHLKLCLLHCVR